MLPHTHSPQPPTRLLACTFPGSIPREACLYVACMHAHVPHQPVIMCVAHTIYDVCVCIYVYICVSALTCMPADIH